MTVTAAVVSRVLASAGFARSKSTPTKIKGFYDRTAGYRVSTSYDGTVHVRHVVGSRAADRLDRDSEVGRMLREYAFALTGKWSTAYSGYGTAQRITVRLYASSVRLSPLMAHTLLKGLEQGGQVWTNPNTACALIDRGLIGPVRASGEAHPLTPSGKRLAEQVAADPAAAEWSTSKHRFPYRTFPRPY